MYNLNSWHGKSGGRDVGVEAGELTAQGNSCCVFAGKIDET